MKILHTSDWHLGHKLYGRQRHKEFSAFLHWLIATINKQHIDALLVAGDIFDSQTPSNSILSLYYHFLSAVSKSCCRHIIITGGNHDSPTLLNAPQELLSSLDIHVTGRVPDNIDDEIIILHDRAGKPELMVLAVPYLRDRDIRTTTADESIDDKQLKLLTGICDHYAQICRLAIEKQERLATNVPIIATGHLFCRGGKTTGKDGVRDLYVGNLVQVGLDCFPEIIDYLALGHLHTAQKVAGQDNRRYSGAPLAMSFQDAGEQKYVILVDLKTNPTITEIPVPHFQQIKSLHGSLNAILSALHSLKQQDESILLEIDYSGERLVDDLQEQIYSAVEGSQLEVLRIRNKRIYDHVLQQDTEIKSLDELSPEQVFLQCMNTHQIPDDQQQELLTNFARVLEMLSDNETKHVVRP